MRLRQKRMPNDSAFLLGFGRPPSLRSRADSTNSVALVRCRASLVASRPLLVRAAKAIHLHFTKSHVLGLPTCCAGAPKSKRRWFHFSSHELDHVARRQPKLGLNGIECSSILPGHLDDSIDICGCQWHGLTLEGFDHQR